jgi:hypothetical protein
MVPKVELVKMKVEAALKEEAKWSQGILWNSSAFGVTLD